MDDRTALRTEVGTRDYQAPEVFGFTDLEDEPLYTSAVDLWALGCVMYRLLTLEKPFPKPSSLRLYCYSMKGFPVEPLYAKDVSEDAVEFIGQLMRANPPERLDAETALKSDWRAPQDSISSPETDSIAEEKIAAKVPVREGNTPPTQAIMTTTSSQDKRSRNENDTDSGVSGEVTVISHAPRGERVVDLQQPGFPLENIHINQSSEEDLERESFMPGDEFHDEDVNHENHIGLNLDTLNQVTKGTSDITDQEEGLEKDSDLPACLKVSESDTTHDEAEVLTSMKAKCPTCRFEGGLRWKWFFPAPFEGGRKWETFAAEKWEIPAESTVEMVYCATHEYKIEQDNATLGELHRTGYLLDVMTISVFLSTNLDAITALHWAAIKGRSREMRYLLERGVDPCAIDNGNRSEKRAAIHHAASAGFGNGVDMLIWQGVNVQALDAKSWTPLHHAVSGGHYWITAALFKAGASLHSRNSFLETPLHCAARNERKYVIELLLYWGADESVRDIQGYTPLDRARQVNHNVKTLRLVPTRNLW